MIEILGLTKNYGMKKVVNNLYLSVHAGDVFGFLGPNGAGKTTTIRMLTTVIRPTEGTAVISGYDIVKDPLKVRQQISVIPQSSTLGVHLDTYENIRLYLMFHGFSSREASRRTEEALKRFDLTDYSRLRPHQLSGGLRRRVQVARALMVGARLLFLDEPSVGLDPVARRETWTWLGQARELGATIFLTTQVMEEAEALCTRVGLLLGGKLVLDGSLKELKNTFGKRQLEISIADISESLVRDITNSWIELNLADNIRGQYPNITANIPSSTSITHLLQTVAERGGRVTHLHMRPPSLEEIYLEVVRK